MNFDFLSEFPTIVKNMNLTSAARELHMTQAALTKHLESAEKELGVRLIDRKRGAATFIGLTLAGEEFLTACLAMTYAYNTFHDKVEEMKALDVRQLRIAASYKRSVSPIAASFEKALAEQRVNVKIRWSENRSKTSYDMVRDGEIDMALEPYSPMADTSRLLSLPIATSAAIIAVHPDDSVACKERLSVSELSRFKFLSLADQTAYPTRKHLHSLANAFGFYPYFEMMTYDSTSIMLTNHLEVGTAFICPALCRDYYSSTTPSAVFLEIEEPEAAFNLRLFYHEDCSAFVKRVAEVLEEAYASR